MVPQYGFKVKNKSNLDLKLISESIYNFVSSLGLVCKVDEEDGSIVLSVDPYTDINFQKNMILKRQIKNFQNLVLNFFQ